jgi:hypothetical protein
MRQRTALVIVFVLVATVAILVASRFASTRLPKASSTVAVDRSGEYVAPGEHSALDFGGFTSIIVCGPLAVFADVVGPAVRLKWREIVPGNFQTLGIPFDPSTAAGEYHWSKSERASFLVRRVAPRHGNEIYLLGHPYKTRDLLTIDASLVVVECWRIMPASGAPYTSRADGTAPIGQPVPLSTLTVGIQGGVYKMPSIRDAPVIQRQLVGTYEMGLLDAVVDPEGRYVVVLDGSMPKSLRFIDLLNPDAPNPTTILSEQQLPQLAGGIAMKMYRQLNGGAKTVVIGCEDRSEILMEDPENDGVFSAPIWLSENDFNFAGLGAMDGWAEDYRLYKLP